MSHPDFLADLLAEINFNSDQEVLSQHGNAVLVKGQPLELAFAENTWRSCQYAEVTSIQKTAAFLKSKSKNWVAYKPQFFRRMSLIEENIHRYNLPDLVFPNTHKLLTPNAWTLLEESKLLYSLDTDSLFPLGRPNFQETKLAPSRAYLKLWEFFIRTQKFPKKNAHCLDMGSCPGGWTWVLDQLGCKITSVDRSPLADSLLKKPNIKNIIKDAFALKAKDIEPLDWFFSDLICYPEKLLELIHYWRENSLAKNFVCTIKFQGPTDFEILKKFHEIPGSKIIHLSVNKHEVTWYLLE